MGSKKNNFKKQIRKKKYEVTSSVPEINFAEDVVFRHFVKSNNFKQTKKDAQKLKQLLELHETLSSKLLKNSEEYDRDRFKLAEAITEFISENKMSLDSLSEGLTDKQLLALKRKIFIKIFRNK